MYPKIRFSLAEVREPGQSRQLGCWDNRRPPHLLILRAPLPSTPFFPQVGGLEL